MWSCVCLFRANCVRSVIIIIIIAIMSARRRRRSTRTRREQQRNKRRNDDAAHDCGSATGYLATRVSRRTDERTHTHACTRHHHVRYRCCQHTHTHACTRARKCRTDGRNALWSVSGVEGVVTTKSNRRDG